VREAFFCHRQQEACRYGNVTIVLLRSWFYITNAFLAHFYYPIKSCK
jgi:hypothetical protein